MRKTLFSVLISILFVGNSYCQDIASAARSGNFANTLTNGGYLEVGAGATYRNLSRLNIKEDEAAGIGIFIGGEYRYEGFFLEAAQGTADGLNLGYNFYNGNGFSVDILASSLSGRNTGRDNDIGENLSEQALNRALRDQDSLYNGAGIRLTAFQPDDNRIYQLRLVSDIHDNNGFQATFRTSKTRQYRNWNFHTIFSLGYLSSDTADYFFGVDEVEATKRFPEFKPSSAWTIGAEAGVTYPLSENWVFRSTLRVGRYSGDIEDSPFITGKGSFSFTTFFTYVF
ncbi:MAG: hypothetical protein GKR91_09510 [Pseudomonadales bacterium]|nr:hypothetical protein [Pseudomonadales bacterium]